MKAIKAWACLIANYAAEAVRFGRGQAIGSFTNRRRGNLANRLSETSGFTAPTSRKSHRREAFPYSNTVQNPWDDERWSDDAFRSVAEEDEAERQPLRPSMPPHQIPLVGEEWRQQREKWKEWVRERPLGVRERRALKELFALKGQPPRDIKGAGLGTMERLEARGFVRTAGEVKPGYVPDYEITLQGEAEWLKICDTVVL